MGWTDVLKQTFGIGKPGLGTVGQVANRVIKPVQDYQGWVNKTNQNFSKRLPKPVNQTVNWTNKTLGIQNRPNLVADFTIRPVAQTTIRGMNAIKSAVGDQTAKNPVAWIPQGRVQKFILGDQPINTWTEQRKNAEQFGVDLGMNRGLASNLSVPLVAAGALLDVSPGGGKKKAGKEVAEGVLKGVIKSKSKKVVQEGAKALKTSKLPTLAKQTLSKKPVSEEVSKGLSALKNSSKEIIPQLEKVVKGGTVKEKSLQVRLSQNKNLPKSVKSMLNGTYVVKDNKTTIKDARNLIRLSPQEAEIRALNPKNAVDMQINAELFNKHISTGNHEKAMTFINNANETNLGQMVQILSQYDKTTPQGAVKFAQKTIDKYNKLNPNNKLNLTPEMINQLIHKAKSIQGMAEGRARNIASQQLIDEVNALIPSSITDKAIAVWKAGLLTSPRTTLRNVLGNSLHAGAEITKDVVASPIDRALSLRTGQRTLTATTRGLVSGAKKGFSSAKDVMQTGFDPENSIQKFDINKVNWGKNKAEQALKKYTDFVFNSLGAQDKPFYHSAFARSLYDQAGAIAKNTGKNIEDIVKNPTMKMLETATKEAELATFKNKNWLGEMASKMKGVAGKNPALKAGAEIVAPFTGVPTSIAGQIVSYSPVGLTKGLYTGGKVLAKNLSELQRQASQEIARGVVGSGIMGIAAYLTAKGLMTGQPRDEAERRQWELEGKQANSILINGKWRSINSVGPEALVALAGSKLAGSKDNTQAIANIGKDFLSQTFLQGVQGPLNALTDPTRYAQQYVQGQAGSVIPNIIKDTAKSLDSTMRESNSVGDSLKAGIPGLRNTLLPKRNALGEPIKQEPSGAWSFVDLFNSKTPIKNPVVNELSRLNIVEQNATPSKLQKTQTVNKQKIKLTPQELDKLEETSGGLMKPALEQLIKSPDYQKLSDEDKAKKIDKVVQDAKTQAKVLVLGQEPKVVKAKTPKKAKKLKAKKVAKGRTKKLTLKKAKLPNLSQPKVYKEKTLKIAKGATGGKSGTGTKPRVLRAKRMA